MVPIADTVRLRSLPIEHPEELVNVSFASGEMFPALRIQPVIGRVIVPEDDRPGCGSPVAVIATPTGSARSAARRLSCSKPSR